FQAEDGIRDFHVTGVQTCALPIFRKAGIGSALLRWLEASCVTAGIQDIRLEVRAGNQLAQMFYRKRDFKVTGRIPGYYDRREARSEERRVGKEERWRWVAGSCARA